MGMTTHSHSEWPDARARREALRTRGQRVVFTNGCFDLLHAGHVRLLERARAEGDYLIVGLNSDRSVSEIKGPGRPLVPAAARAEVLSAFEAVDLVVAFDEPSPLRLIEAILPDVLAKGADWAHDAIVGRAAVEQAGGRVVRIELLPERSTTRLLGGIKGP
jgi:D-beta-D-heptose 7-phosphate kinase/D-beta-D-heptose 1-phosphate adenosyltransferase